MATATKAAGTSPAGGFPQYTPAQLTQQDITPEQLEALARLREPFPASQIRKRPQVNCPDCNRANKQKRGATCDKHPKEKCKECHQRVGSQHIHLDFVGHAEATHRLLDVDPTWNWEPVAWTEEGLPKIDEFGGLWIKLTVCGVTRLGYGDATGKDATTTAIKEIIGDGIRNAGMRFGLALDLWTSSDLHEVEPHPAEKYYDRLRALVWESPELLAGIRREAEAEDPAILEWQAPKAGGVTLGQIIDGRLTVLADAAEMVAEKMAEQRLRREEKAAQRATAAQQVAQQNPTPPQQGRPPQGRGQQGRPPAQRQQAPQGPPAQPAELTPQEKLNRLQQQVANSRANLDAMRQCLAQAEAWGISGTELDIEGNVMTVAQLLGEYIKELEEYQPTGTAGAVAAGARRQNQRRSAG